MNSINSLKKYLITACLVFLQYFLFTQTSPIWGNLEKGNYNIGFSTQYLYDLSRPPLYEQKQLPLNQQDGRVMQINIWYPTFQKGQVVSLLDYFHLTAKEINLNRKVNSIDELMTIVQQEQGNSHGIELDQEGLKVFLETNVTMEASIDAVPVNDKFPLIIIGPETAFKWCLLGEYLASHGYVVITTPLAGPSEKLPGFERTLFDKQSFMKTAESSIRDLQFVYSFAKGLPYVDEVNIGISGYSGNIGSGLGLITSGIDIKAIVSLEGNIGGFIGGEILSMTSFYSPYKITQPFLHIMNPAFGSNDFWLKKYKYADRTLIATKDIRHEHLSTYGMLDTFVPGVSGDVKHPAKTVLESAYDYTLNFFNYHLKEKNEAKEFIEKGIDLSVEATDFQFGVEPKWEGIKRYLPLKTYDEYELNSIYSLGNIEDIQHTYEKLSVNNSQPFSKSTFFNFGRFIKTPEEKEIWYTYYVECYSDFSEPYFLLAQEQHRLKKREKAVKNYKKALSLFQETDHIILEDIFTRVINHRLKKLEE